MTDRQRRLFISWNKDQTRSESLSFYLGATYYCICPFAKKAGVFRYVFLLMKYVSASFNTLLLLRKVRPVYNFCRESTDICSAYRLDLLQDE